MRCILQLLTLAMILTGNTAPLPGSPEKEFLTDKEIEKIREAQEIDLRIKIYLDAAALRLRSAEDRMSGNESKEGDPLELFTPEEMLDGYHRILRSVMFNLDDAFQKPSTDRGKLEKALKNLKGTTEKCGKELQILKKMAEDAKKEELWNLVNKSIDITAGAREGAEFGLSKLPASKTKGK